MRLFLVCVFLFALKVNVIVSYKPNVHMASRRTATNFHCWLFLNSIINLAPEMLKKLHGKSVFHDELEVPFH